MNSDRRNFLKVAGLSLGGSLLSQNLISKPLNILSMETKEPLKPELVKDFVLNAHANLDKVKALLASEPALLNASWDWGGGDFETALNAAGHTGHVDIAMYLLEAGARMDVFCAAMLGRLDIVKPILENYPYLKTSKGPHGLMLLHHARQGKENAKEVLQYLESIETS